MGWVCTRQPGSQSKQRLIKTINTLFSLFNFLSQRRKCFGGTPFRLGIAGKVEKMGVERLFLLKEGRVFKNRTRESANRALVKAIFEALNAFK